MALMKSDNVATNKYEVEVSVDAATFDTACNAAYRKNIKKINVPGFRRRQSAPQDCGKNVW